MHKIRHRNLRHMTTPEGNEPEGGGTPAGGTYTPPATQADLERIIATRLSRERAKFANYDELKTKAEQSDTALAALQTDLDAAVARATTAEGSLAQRDAADEAKTLRETVAQDKGVAASILRGGTREELEAHADELLKVLPAAPVIPAAPSPEGLGNAGDSVQGEHELSVEDVVAQATGKK